MYEKVCVDPRLWIVHSTDAGEVWRANFISSSLNPLDDYTR